MVSMLKTLCNICIYCDNLFTIYLLWLVLVLLHYNFHIIQMWNNQCQARLLVRFAWQIDSDMTHKKRWKIHSFSATSLSWTRSQWIRRLSWEQKVEEGKQILAKQDVSSSYLRKVSLASVFQACWISQVSLLLKRHTYLFFLLLRLIQCFAMQVHSFINMQQVYVMYPRDVCILAVQCSGSVVI